MLLLLLCLKTERQKENQKVPENGWAAWTSNVYDRIAAEDKWEKEKLALKHIACTNTSTTGILTAFTSLKHSSETRADDAPHTKRNEKIFCVRQISDGFSISHGLIVNICSPATRRCTLQRPRFPRRRMCENHDSMHFSLERGIPLRWLIFSFISYIFYLRNWTFERAASNNLLRCQKLLCQWMAWIMLWIHTKLNFHSWNHRRWCSASNTICFSMTSRERWRKCARDVCVGLEAEIRPVGVFSPVASVGKSCFSEPPWWVGKADAWNFNAILELLPLVTEARELAYYEWAFIIAKHFWNSFEVSREMPIALIDETFIDKHSLPVKREACDKTEKAPRNVITIKRKGEKITFYDTLKRVGWIIKQLLVGDKNRKFKRSRKIFSFIKRVILLPIFTSGYECIIIWFI